MKNHKPLCQKEAEKSLEPTKIFADKTEKNRCDIIIKTKKGSTKRECNVIGKVEPKNETEYCSNQFFEYPVCYEGKTNSEIGENTRNVVYLWTMQTKIGEIAVYVGYTTDFIHFRCRNHKKPSGGCVVFKRRLRKYMKKFKCRIIEQKSRMNELKKLETYYIKKFKTFRDINPKYGCNMTEGGEGHKISKEVRHKLSCANRGIDRTSEEYKNLLRTKYSGEGNPFYGKTHSSENKKLQRKRMLGKKMTKDTKTKMSSSQDERWAKLTHRGISMHKLYGKYIAFGKKPNSPRKYLGLCKTIEDAKKSIQNYEYNN